MRAIHEPMNQLYYNNDIILSNFSFSKATEKTRVSMPYNVGFTSVWEPVVIFLYFVSSC